VRLTERLQEIFIFFEVGNEEWKIGNRLDAYGIVLKHITQFLFSISQKMKAPARIESI